EKQTDKTFPEFWEKYCDAEKKIYAVILKTPDAPVEGTFAALVEKFDVDPVFFAGFLDGVNTSLKEEIEDIDAIEDDTALKLEIDIPKLYFNMQSAEADHLYTLPEWDSILTDEEREAIVKEYKRSRTVRVEKKPGRNEPCPCGSGKKYKKCCGQTA
ncbi:MAG: SEC-C domain-containing protein, partial [Clostridiales Family XIII bacterium]|nr:SEC-C domain-containing protein [Clostridiales Family XIII bacterium]